MTLSHEFRTPLQSILLLLQSLLQVVQDESVRKMVWIVISQINLMICMVNDFLDLNMINEGKF